jgi:hypothetical protein
MKPAFFHAVFWNNTDPDQECKQEDAMHATYYGSTEINKTKGLEEGYNKKKKGMGGQLYLSIKKTSCEKDNINTKMACF